MDIIGFAIAAATLVTLAFVVVARLRPRPDELRPLLVGDVVVSNVAKPKDAPQRYYRVTETTDSPDMWWDLKLAQFDPATGLNYQGEFADSRFKYALVLRLVPHSRPARVLYHSGYYRDLTTANIRELGPEVLLTDLAPASSPPGE